MKNRTDLTTGYSPPSWGRDRERVLDSQTMPAGRPSPPPSPTTGEGVQSATIKLTALRDLWFHTGTACNLECPFCLEDSKPGDTRLERVTLADLKPYFDEAVQLGVERFAFTGGEPLIVKDIVKILSHALQLRPCLVITNGTAPLLKRVHQLQTLQEQPQTLSFCVSIDHPNETLHDAGRGWGNFKRAIEGVRLLQQTGFAVSIIRRSNPEEDTGRIAVQFRDLLRKHELADTSLIALPELGRPGAKSDAAPPTVDDLANCPSPPMCSTSRMVLKRGGQMRVYACALTDDDPQFDLGGALTPSLSAAIALKHPRCGQCVRHKVALGG